MLEVNDEQHRVITGKLERLVGGLAGRTIGVWGLAFKPNTDDVRDSPSLAVIRDILARGARIRAYDPAVDPGRDLRRRGAGAREPSKRSRAPTRCCC